MNSRSMINMTTSRTLCQAATLSRTVHRSTLFQHHCYYTTSACQQDTQSRLPRVANPALWRGMIPKVFRKERVESEESATTIQIEEVVREKNPGVSLIILGLLAGSFAINIISLRQELTNFSRKTETKLTILREVIQKVKAGEDVDVKRLLGTGDPESEREWEEMVRELETTDMLAISRDKQATTQARKKEQIQHEQDLRKSRQTASADETRGTESGPKFMM